MHPLFPKANGLTEKIIAGRFDVLVENCVLIEAKAVERLMPIHKAQLLSYINLNEAKLTDGVSRLILPKANQ